MIFDHARELLIDVIEFWITFLVRVLVDGVADELEIWHDRFNGLGFQVLGRVVAPVDEVVLLATVSTEVKK